MISVVAIMKARAYIYLNGGGLETVNYTLKTPKYLNTWVLKQVSNWLLVGR